MITDLWIENFKGIGQRQHIPLRPVTLLFGANSAGKSTVLHALMYLREILCNCNLNPTKPIAGENTINLGGLENLFRRSEAVDEDESDHVLSESMTLGCRFSADVKALGLLHDSLWEDRYYHLQVGTYEDKAARTEGDKQDAGTSSQVRFAHDPLLPSVNELSITICSDCTPHRINKFEWHFNDVPLLNCWKLPNGHQCCWINPYHLSLGPFGGMPDSMGIDSLWAEHLSRRVRNVVTSAFGENLPRIHEMEPVEKKYATLAFPLTCPRWNGKFSQFKISAVESGVPVDRLLGDCGVWPLAQLINAYRDDGSVVCGQDVGLEDVLIGIDLEQSGEFTPITADKILFVSIPEELADSTGRILEIVRYFFSGSALSGDFLLSLDAAGLPDDRRPLFGITDFVAAMHSGSVGPRSWLPQQLARVDQSIRLAARYLRDCLSDLCYVGPKRSSVPRNLNEAVLDEYSSWGNGLGAWRWLLNKNECSDHSFQRCAVWLSEPEFGLGTGFSLRRDGVFEMSMNQFREFVANSIDWDQLRHSMRIELYDQRSRTKRHPQEVGEGITQLVPVIAACVRASGAASQEQLVAIEQPELHLHPSLAARLGDLLISSSIPSSDPSFIGRPSILVETHSEHLILRILRRIRQTTNDELPEHIPPVKPDDVCVLWVDNLGDGTTYQRLRIDNQGEFIDRWPRGFFSERAEELY